MKKSQKGGEKYMTGTGVGLRTILIIAGGILAVVGIVMGNWKLAVIGDTVAVVGALFT